MIILACKIIRIDIQNKILYYKKFNEISAFNFINYKE